MAVRVYRFRPPEISATLTAGGTLLPNTTYYIAGFFKRHWSYTGVESVFSNVETFTTDASNRSVSIAWKVTVPIQGFADAGGGLTRVSATNHCVTAGNTIIIETGVHAGTYTVTTWEDYNTFLITLAFSSDYATTFRSETPVNTSDSMMLYMDTVPPFTGDPTQGTWRAGTHGQINKFSHYQWVVGYTTTPAVVTAPFTLRKYGYSPQIQGTYYKPATWCKVMEKGTVWIECTGTATVDEIKQACKDADVEDVAYVDGNNETFLFYGILRAYYADLTFTDISIINYGGMISDYGYYKLKYLRCSVQFLQTTYSYYSGEANYSSFMWNLSGFVGMSPLVQPYSYPKGANNYFNSPDGLAAEGLGVNAQFDNLTVNMNSGVWRIDCRNKLNAYTNITLNKGYVYLYYTSEATGDTTYRSLNNWYIDSPLAYDFDIQYNNSALFFNMRNIDTTRTDNRKLCHTPYLNQTYRNPTLAYNFYRGGTITIYDVGGDILSGATIQISSDSEIKSYTTDANGQITFEILEQLTTQADTGYDYDNTYYDNWTLTVSADGYETYTSFSRLAKDIELEVTLKTQVKTRKDIEGNLYLAIHPETGSSAKIIKL